MKSNAQDIKEFEELLDNAGSNDELCDKAIAVGGRIIKDMEAMEARGKAGPRPSQQEIDDLEHQCDDFDAVLKKIGIRRRDKALDRYKKWGESIIKQQAGG